MKNFIKINEMSRAVLKKCDCCNKVQDVKYRCDILNFGNRELLEGDLYLCFSCGSNLNLIIGNELEVGEKVVKSFNF